MPVWGDSTVTAFCSLPCAYPSRQEKVRLSKSHMEDIAAFEKICCMTEGSFNTRSSMQSIEELVVLSREVHLCDCRKGQSIRLHLKQRCQSLWVHLPVQVHPRQAIMTSFVKESGAHPKGSTQVLSASASASEPDRPKST